MKKVEPEKNYFHHALVLCVCVCDVKFVVFFLFLCVRVSRITNRTGTQSPCKKKTYYPTAAAAAIANWNQPGKVAKNLYV
mgnify:CR=1 FL=1